ncbi:MAG: radical SAM protein [Planctomycetes bacterium]|nr:radical SAM protein [Planctomycetota bacterium]
MAVTQEATSNPAGPSGAKTATYQRPPILQGYTYDPQEAWRARDDGRLLALRLETNRTCNLRCRYCYALSGRRLEREMAFDTLADVIDQAADLGARSIVVIGGGEPTLHPRFRDLVARIDERGMVPVVFTNGMLVDHDVARFLHDHNASVMGKLDSLRAAVQDYLAGSPGASRLIRQGLDHLMDVGFCDAGDPHRLRLGVSFVSCRLNLNEIDGIWHFCRECNIFPNMEVLTPTGRAKRELPDQALSREEVQAYKSKLLEIDRANYGFDWLPHTPLAASGCLQHLYSLYVTITGDVRPCAPTKFDEHPDLKINGVYPHNVLRRSLRAIYEDPLFDYVRHIDRHLEGKCGPCPHRDECIGCRGYAYAVGVNAGKDPRAALRAECLQCARQDAPACEK